MTRSRATISRHPCSLACPLLVALSCRPSLFSAHARQNVPGPLQASLILRASTNQLFSINSLRFTLWPVDEGALQPAICVGILALPCDCEPKVPAIANCRMRPRCFDTFLALKLRLERPRHQPTWLARFDSPFLQYGRLRAINASRRHGEERCHNCESSKTLSIRDQKQGVFPFGTHARTWLEALNLLRSSTRHASR